MDKPKFIQIAVGEDDGVYSLDEDGGVWYFYFNCRKGDKKQTGWYPLDDTRWPLEEK